MLLGQVNILTVLMFYSKLMKIKSCWFDNSVADFKHLLQLHIKSHGWLDLEMTMFEDVYELMIRYLYLLHFLLTHKA